MFAGMMVLGFLLVVTTASPGLAAYSSHQNDEDINNFLAVYPYAKSTKLDDCALCHPGGKIGSKTYGSCDYCHQTYKLQEPHGAIPLNSYGAAYKDAYPVGDPNYRSQQALRNIEGMNSDGDCCTNIQEIQALTFPGDDKDYPGLLPAPAIGLNLERILEMPDHSQFLLLNATNSKDFYARYRGVKIKDLLKYAGVRPEATQIAVLSPDGFSQTFPIDAPDPQTDPTKVQYDVMGPYPHGYYFSGLDFVDYAFAPSNLEDGDRIPDHLYMLLAYLRDGEPLTPGKINPGTLKLDGEGPYRLIPPQKIVGIPGQEEKCGTYNNEDYFCQTAGPDRPAPPKPPTPPPPPVKDGYDYNPAKDHNAGFSARTVSAIRVEPLPAGTTDFNVFEGGWNLVDHAKLVIYGAIDPRTYPVEGRVSDDNRAGIPDVKISFSLLSLGQVGEATTSSKRGYSKKRGESGKFSIDLPTGEYTVIPSKEGCTFTPASLSISIPDPEHGRRHDRNYDKDHHSKYEIKFSGSCVTP
jgi:hypothetical protein